MNFLSLFVLIPLLMLLGLWLSRNISQIRTVMVTGASALLVLSIALTVMYLQARQGGATDEMLFCADVAWYPALNIHYSVGVDGISVVMLLLSSRVLSLPGVCNRLRKNISSGSRSCPWVCSASSSR